MTSPEQRHLDLTRAADGTQWTRLAGVWVQVIPRSEFLAHHWHYEYGQHVGVVGPTQVAGKTRLLGDLLSATDTTDLTVPPVMLIGKPQDRTLSGGMLARIGFREVHQWPPRAGWFQEKPAGWAFWPKHLRDATPERDNDYISAQFDRAIQDVFWKGDTILVVDELHYVFLILKKQGMIDRHLTQGMGMGSAVWFGTQQPGGTQTAGGLSGFVFNSPYHLFFAWDPVKTNRKKFGVVGGVDPRIIEEATYVMPPYYFLYIYRDGPRICIVTA